MPATPKGSGGTCCPSPLSMLGFSVPWACPGPVCFITTIVSSCAQRPAVSGRHCSLWFPITSASWILPTPFSVMTSESQRACSRLLHFELNIHSSVLHGLYLDLLSVSVLIAFYENRSISDEGCKIHWSMDITISHWEFGLIVCPFSRIIIVVSTLGSVVSLATHS